MQEIDYTYIHNCKEHFLEVIQSSDKFSIPDGLNEEILKEYVTMYNSAKDRMSEFNNKLGLSAKKIESLIASTQNLESILRQNLDLSLDERLKKASIDAIQLSSAFKNIQESSNLAERLNKFLESLEGIINDFNKVDEALIDYYSNSSQKASLVLSFGNGKDLKILNINKSAMTSIESLSSRIKGLRGLIDNGSSSIGSGMMVTYNDSKGNSKQVPIEESFYSMRQLIINILGGFGEGLTALKIINKTDEIINEFQKKVNSIPDVTMTVSGQGTKKLVSGKVSKSDVAITFSDGEANFSVGISAKAQFHKSTGLKTTFQTSQLQAYLTSLNTNIQYQFLNNLYLGSYNTNNQILMNRYIAAKNFDNAVTGSGIGDNVLFLSYLNKTISIEDFYNSLVNIGNDIVKLPRVAIKGAAQIHSSQFSSGEHYKIDLNPMDKSQAALYRARLRRNALLSLKAQIQFYN